jgi:N4-gp56 family major capsid protein
MADFTLATASAKEVWSDQFTAEYIRDSALLPYMGMDETSIIRVRKELTGQAGAAVHFPLVMRLRGAGVTGSTTLYGSEDTLSNYSDCVRTTLKRNAVMITEDQSFKTELDLFNAGRNSLKNWAAEQLRDDVITELQAIIVKQGGSNNEDTSVSYAAATAGQRNSHVVNNADRVLFGTAKANASSGVMATALATINNTAGAGKISAATLRVAKTMAKKAGAAAGTSHIAPFRSEMTKGQEFYVLFIGSEGFRDLSADSEIVAANTNARAREGDGVSKNPLFQDGDLLYRGIIIREVPEMPVISAAGAAGIDVACAALCGSVRCCSCLVEEAEPAHAGVRLRTP